jgi:hypothetical protein
MRGEWDRCVPRETITKDGVQQLVTPLARPRRGVYSERLLKRRVNTQLASRLVAQRPLNSMRLAVSERASRSRPPGTDVTDGTPDQGDEVVAPAMADPMEDPAGPLSERPEAVDSPELTSPELTPAIVSLRAWLADARGTAEPNPAIARSAPAASPNRASSIIPSNRPRTETPRRAASASTQARRSWSSRMPTTVDLVGAMTPLTVIRGVYSSGAERWQPGGGRQTKALRPRSAPAAASPRKRRLRLRPNQVASGACGGFRGGSQAVGALPGRSLLGQPGNPAGL